MFTVAPFTLDPATVVHSAHSHRCLAGRLGSLPCRNFFKSGLHVEANLRGIPIPAQTHRCGTVCLPAARDNEQWTVKDFFPEPLFGVTGASVVFDLTAQWQVSRFGKWTNNESILFNFSFNMEFGILVVFSCVTTCLSCSVSCVCDPVTMLS